MLSVLHGPATAQWKWVDAEGRVNYSDLPPPDGGTGTPVRISPLQSSPPDRSDAPGTDAAAGDAGRASVAERAAEFAERQRAREKAQRAEAQRERALAARARSCELLRGSLRTLESGARIAEVDADGQRRLLDADERARRISETRTTLAAQCGSL